MSEYSVSVIFDACKSVMIKAGSAKEAAELAYDEVGYVGLCHQCSSEIEVADATRAIVYDDAGDEVFDDGYENAKIKELERQRDDLLAALEGLLDDMRLRAKIDGDVDSDGRAVLNCGNGVLYAATTAISKAKGGAELTS